MKILTLYSASSKFPYSSTPGVKRAQADILTKPVLLPVSGRAGTAKIRAGPVPTSICIPHSSAILCIFRTGFKPVSVRAGMAKIRAGPIPTSNRKPSSSALLRVFKPVLNLFL